MATRVYTVTFIRESVFGAVRRVSPSRWKEPIVPRRPASRLDGCS